MQDEADRADTDRVHEGYQQRYEKERRASYALVSFGLLAFFAVGFVMFMHHVDHTARHYANVEPAAGAATREIPAE